MDIQKLDMLLKELKLADNDAKSVDFNEFCNKKWGETGKTFAICDQLVRTLVADGYAEHPGVDKRRIRLTSSGRKFKGYAQKELDDKVALDNDTEFKKITIENLRLQNERLAYQDTIRDKESEIRQLTINNLKLQNKHFRQYILYAIIGSITTLIIGNRSTIVSFLQSIFQK